MSRIVNVLAISGSLRRGSYNTAALRAAQELAPEGVTVTIAPIADIPVYNDDVKAEGLPASVVALCDAIRAADAVLMATPEYNYSIPGVLKNAIDWVSRAAPPPFADKPVAIMGASGGLFGTARAQYDLRKVFVFLDGHVLNKPEVFIGSAKDKFDVDGTLKDAVTRDLIAKQLSALQDWTLRLKP